MKAPGIKIFLMRAFQYGSAISASTAFGQGLTKFDDDGQIVNEPSSLYQFGDELHYLLNNFERFLSDRKSQIQEAFQQVNNDEWIDDNEPNPIELVVHCTSPHPQIVLEFRKILKRYFNDEDLYELVDIVIKMDPRRVEDEDERRECEKFQAYLFA